MATLISEKMGFKTEMEDIKKKGHFRMINQGYIIIISIRAPNNRASKYTKQN